MYTNGPTSARQRLSPLWGQPVTLRNVYNLQLYKVVADLKLDQRDQLERSQAFHNTGSVPALVYPC